MNIVAALKWFHNWVGFVITLTMLIVLSTGVYLGAMDILKRIDDKGQVYAPMTTEQKAQSVAAIFERYPEMSSVNFPTEYRPYLQASTRGKAIFLDQELNEIGDYNMREIPFYSTIFWLHRNFLLDDFGKYTNGIASLLGGVITLVGIYLWWRVRKGFRLKQSIPSNTRSSSLVKSHIQLGLFISVPLFILCISGFLITYKGLWFGALKHTPAVEMQYPTATAKDWHSQLTLAQAQWPESDLVSVSKQRAKKPKDGEKPKPQPLRYNVRFDEHSGVWLRNADNIAMNFDTGAMTSKLKHSERDLSGRVATFVRPLHDAMNMPLSYSIFITLIAVVGTVILLFSTVTFYRRTFKKRKS
ncbi:PepSY domain-containing protein [Shewanella sp. WXL01]|uniref:PepSY domain-containing protein n=1 Tax=Shewanella maritima TaxID=2520507 RepID=A0A411PIH8_9GAMM|nr:MULTISPECIES: PepSY-associated TM helix domain-containing protein [Shewanella]NKF52131.1 PepSY domain-containing protein [Shewanella sp. WXL01]QBF83397.1 hypothetical protein EXU30_12330 [Shewanella maritima]